MLRRIRIAYLKRRVRKHRRLATDFEFSPQWVNSITIHNKALDKLEQLGEPVPVKRL